VYNHTGVIRTFSG